MVKKSVDQNVQTLSYNKLELQNITVALCKRNPDNKNRNIVVGKKNKRRGNKQQLRDGKIKLPSVSL